jgi:hypothetical protein
LGDGFCIEESINQSSNRTITNDHPITKSLNQQIIRFYERRGCSLQRAGAEG